MQDHCVKDKELMRKVRQYAFFFNWVPALIGIITVIIGVSYYLFTFGRLPLYLIILVGCFCATIPRVVQKNIMLGMYRKGELALFRQLVCKSCASPRSAPYILGECAAGEHQAVINVCTKMLSQRKWNRRLRYLWLSGLSDCYFELGDDQKLLLVCEAFDRLAEKENDARRIAGLADVFARYRAYAQRDEAKCREILAQAPKTEYSINIYESAFFAARVSQHVLGDDEAARAYYAKAASWNEEYSFVRTAKLELEAMERGECYTDALPEVLPDPDYIPRAGREYMRTNLGVLVVYTVAMLLVIVTTVILAPGILERRYERELQQLLQQDYISVQELDRFNVHVGGELIETMFVCHMDETLVIGSAYTRNGQLVYQNQRIIPVNALQNASKPIGPIEHRSILGTHAVTTMIYLNAEDLPKQTYYVATVTIDGKTYYIAVTEVTPIP